MVPIKTTEETSTKLKACHPPHPQNRHIQNHTTWLSAISEKEG